jgi:tRNA (guanine-N7-)-methyltransferase
MARLRKAAKIWRRPQSRTAAGCAEVEAADGFFAVNPTAIFGSAGPPLEIELGAGTGDFIIARAGEFPDRNFLAIESSRVVARMLAVRCGRAALRNLRVIRMDARTLVNLMIGSRSVSAYHVYFPDPWPKERHHKRRLFTPYLVANLERTLTPGGTLYVATDVGDYAGEIFAMLDATALVRSPEEVPGSAKTAFGRKFAAGGKAIHARAYRKSPALETRPFEKGAGS